MIGEAYNQTGRKIPLEMAAGNSGVKRRARQVAAGAHMMAVNAASSSKMRGDTPGRCKLVQSNHRSATVDRLSISQGAGSGNAVYKGKRW